MADCGFLALPLNFGFETLKEAVLDDELKVQERIDL